MKLLDARRLTGLNVQTATPGPIVEIQISGSEEATRFIRGFETALELVREHLDFEISALVFRHFERGLAITANAPIDALYAAVAVFEWAANRSIAEFQGADTLSNVDDVLMEVRSARQEERSTQLMQLIDEAEKRSIPYLWDDDEFSLGYGKFSTTWSRQHLPEIDELVWYSYSVPPMVAETSIALVSLKVIL